MARTIGIVHASYPTDGQKIDPSEVAIFGSKLAALEHAVDNSRGYVPWPHGKTLQQAIDDYQAAKSRGGTKIVIDTKMGDKP